MVSRLLPRVLAVLTCAWGVAAQPNVLFILADDLGYGSVSAYNSQSEVKTPNIDRIASQGMTFTDAHSGSSICSPTRYGILTGRYGWRSRLRSEVLKEFARPLVESERLTVGRLMQQAGYHTACIGKWHLGWDWPEVKNAKRLSQPIGGGPTTRGFDYYFGEGTANQPPFCFFRNDRATSPLGPGLRADDWRDENFMPVITEKAVAYLRERASLDSPFFLYYSPAGLHRPWLRSSRFLGKSGINRYADCLMELDQSVGQVLDVLDEVGLADDTLVFFASDNGPECFKEDRLALVERGAAPSYRFRGAKADLWEGGHRIPFMVRWPGKIEPGSRCSEIVCTTDLMATVAELLELRLPDDAAEDSFSMLPWLTGTSPEPDARRTSVIHHSWSGALAIRQGRWKLLACADSGGFGALKPNRARRAGLHPMQLFDLQEDSGETTNLYGRHPDTVRRLAALLAKQQADQRTAPRR